MTAKRASLFGDKTDAVTQDRTTTSLQDNRPASPLVDVPAGQQADVPTRQPYPKASTREGKKSITVYVEPETMKQLRRLKEADEDEGKDTSIQDLMIEAINALFAKRGVTRLAS